MTSAPAISHEQYLKLEDFIETQRGVISTYKIVSLHRNLEVRLKMNNKNPILNFRVVISSFLVMVILLLGIIFLFIGIKDTYILNRKTENYISTNGYFIDYEIYNSSKRSTTYKLNYIYLVDGKEYAVSTDYGAGYIPEKNSVRIVKYNPDNPEESILIGTNSKNFLIYLGTFFILGSVAFILVALQIKGTFDKIEIDVIGLYLGIVLLIIGTGAIFLQNGTTSSLLETVKSLKIWAAIPLLFILIGVFQTTKCVFVKRTTKKKNSSSKDK